VPQDRGEGMKVTLVGHASILIEAGGLSILSDPWWRGPCFGAQWWNYPEPYLHPLEGRRIDYIYVSHGHHDHFHPATLNTLNQDAVVLVSAHTGLAAAVRELGFDVLEVPGTRAVALGNGGVTCRIIQTFGTDTLMTITDGAEVCVSLNDALHSAPEALQRQFIAQLRALHPRMDYVFCGYGVASHFPNCYTIPGKDREATAARRQAYFNRQWARLIAGLQPVYGFPFAADVVLLENDLFWANEPTHNSERPTAALAAEYPGSPVTAIDIAPGFAIEDGRVIREALWRPVRASNLLGDCATGIERANRYRSVGDQDVNDVAVLVRDKVAVWRPYLNGYAEDYRFLIRFHNGQWGVRIEKRGQKLSVEPVPLQDQERFDVTYTTRLPYLKGALTRPFGDELLFVGSGGTFAYADQASARRNVHRELMHILRSDSTPPASRGRTSGTVLRAKQIAKSILGRTEPDLYDLATWTVFHD
jgi:hypothetical protein